MVRCMYEQIKSFRHLVYAIIWIVFILSIDINHYQTSPGIKIQPSGDEIFDLLVQNLTSHIKRPWVIAGFKGKIYSQIDKPLYLLTNDTLFEHFELKSVQKSNELGKVHSTEFQWNKNMAQNC